jgi:hypothetical protein
MATNLDLLAQQLATRKMVPAGTVNTADVMGPGFQQLASSQAAAPTFNPTPQTTSGVGGASLATPGGAPPVQAAVNTALNPTSMGTTAAGNVVNLAAAPATAPAAAASVVGHTDPAPAAANAASPNAAIPWAAHTGGGLPGSWSDTPVTMMAAPGLSPMDMASHNYTQAQIPIPAGIPTYVNSVTGITMPAVGVNNSAGLAALAGAGYTPYQYGGQYGLGGGKSQSGTIF